VGTLKRALEEMFTHADRDGSGSLSYQEFADAFKTLSYGLTENDIKTLIALADENHDGKISWQEFIPVGIDSIKTFFARNKTVLKMKERDRDIKREALKLIYHDEIVKCGAIMLRRFKAIDEKNSGVISIKDLRGCLNSCSLITPKEINVILRSFKATDTVFEYKNFEQLLFDVRYELAKSRLMDTGLDKLTEHLIQEFSRYDTAQVGTITITEVKKALFNSKQSNLTPFQVYTLIGMSKPDAEGRVNYREFAGECKTLIEELFSMKSMSEKAELIQSHIYRAPENLDAIELTSLELFELFKKFDRNQNGFLEIHEYIQCLKDSGINLREQEIVTLGLSADVNGDERIDYEEFMKHFQDCLKMVRFQSTLHTAYMDHCKNVLNQ
jgi:Ca2+-binding EF-hand superfamily protein